MGTAITDACMSQSLTAFIEFFLRRRAPKIKTDFRLKYLNGTMQAYELHEILTNQN